MTDDEFDRLPERIDELMRRLNSPVTCDWIRDDDGVWSHMQFDAEEEEAT